MLRMYALYNNLTFNNLKMFDANVFQVRACFFWLNLRHAISAHTTILLLLLLLLRPLAANELAHRHYRRSVIRGPVPASH